MCLWETYAIDYSTELCTDTHDTEPNYADTHDTEPNYAQTHTIQNRTMHRHMIHDREPNYAQTHTIHDTAPNYAQTHTIHDTAPNYAQTKIRLCIRLQLLWPPQFILSAINQRRANGKLEFITAPTSFFFFQVFSYKESVRHQHT